MSSPLAALGGVGGSSLLISLTPMAAQAFNYTGKPAPGTGVQQLIAWAGSQNLLVPATISAIVPELPGAFGGYPQNVKSETGPDILFIVLFAILFAAHLGMFFMNLTRKQNFFLQLGFAFFCALKVIGFSCRLAWAHNVTNLNVGIASLVFIQVAQLLLQSLNMVLAHRIFTWRHPESGTHWLIVHFINLIYFLVLAVIVMAILGQGLPYVYFMEHHHLNMCKNVMKAAAVLNLVYASLPVQLLVIAFALKPGTIVKAPKVFNKITQQRERIMPSVFQASWIKSARLFYYPEKNSQIPIYKGDPGSKAVRIIPSREPPGNGHHQFGQEVHPYAPHMHWATLTVTVTSLVLIMNTCFRVAACFHTTSWATLVNGNWKVNFWPEEYYVMFIFYGGTEVAILVFYLLMRIDLRFYIPDMPKSPPKNGVTTHNEGLELEQQQDWADAPADFEKKAHSHDSGSPLRF